ncbi:MAG: type II secretion system F family protein [Acidimicrobiia bacterium]|nr:type II secretion system F family protein [Acidimicrobiia bacterium]MYH55610.1 type II secretion system F family protein [Acidimicrobiia bacterium]
MISGLAIIAVASSVVCAVAAVSIWVRPPRRLRSRVRPYSSVTRLEPGMGTGFLDRARPSSPLGNSTIRRLLAPMLTGAVYPLARFLMPMDDQELSLRLRQAGYFPEMEEAARPLAYRMRSLGRMVGYATGLGAVGLWGGNSGFMVVSLIAVGALVGAYQSRSRLAEAVRRRRARIRSELYTINQLVAMYTRAGGGLIQALRYVVTRARGIAVDELADALHLHDRGWTFADALARAEKMTPEPEAARTYRLLATSQEQGFDLSDALLSLSKELREGRRNELRRMAARRRVLIVIPVVVILAPVTMLFMAAPIPSILFGG